MYTVYAHDSLIVFAAGSIVALVVVSAGKNSLIDDNINNMQSIDYMWRLLIGLGCIPGVIALYFRLTIDETPRFVMDVERHVNQAAQDVEDFLTRGGYWVH